MDNSQVIEIDEDDDEEEAKDELYCMMTTKIVGVQYYKGSPQLFCDRLCSKLR